jgi:hypothetical protein
MMITRKQASGVCGGCGGAIRFYPAPVPDEQAEAESPADVPTTGSWAHLDPADWKHNPHRAEPAAVT